MPILLGDFVVPHHDQDSEYGHKETGPKKSKVQARSATSGRHRGHNPEVTGTSKQSRVMTSGTESGSPSRTEREECMLRLLGPPRHH
ncbi:hypothetical protein BDM02DRAFT_3112299 [Thelephora ganbajun]|uniref:Uncharacterized protein n=1 Tax=Thelephora ganbajun TaxID=370292 RepID=A0ACB6ZL43_THEGA|nr:hypothetical protein BDM02DRAFT_3112299 [Thelephora ganbajun]